MEAEYDQHVISVRDRVHFYKVISWLNNRLGRGRENWSMGGRPLRRIERLVEDAARPRHVKIDLRVNRKHRENFSIVEFMILNS